MIDLTNTYADEQKKHTGILQIRSAESGWLIGVVSDVEAKLDPMEKVEVSGTYADGTKINSYPFDVPLSICLKGAIPIMEYLIEHYGLKP